MPKHQHGLALIKEVGGQLTNARFLISSRSFCASFSPFPRKMHSSHKAYFKQHAKFNQVHCRAAVERELPLRNWFYFTSKKAIKMSTFVEYDLLFCSSQTTIAIKIYLCISFEVIGQLLGLGNFTSPSHGMKNRKHMLNELEH